MSKVSLCMLVRDGGTKLIETLDSAASVVGQLVLVDDGSIDGTPATARAWAEGRGIPCTIVSVPEELHVLDLAESFKPISDVELPGPFSGLPLLSDWASARNLAFAHATHEWTLWLDVDDIVENPDKVAADIARAEKFGADQAQSYYRIRPMSGSYVTWSRGHLNRRTNRFTGRIHEYVHSERAVQGQLVVRDRRSAGYSFAAHGLRNLKASWLAAQDVTVDNVDAAKFRDVRSWLLEQQDPTPKAIEFFMSLNPPPEDCSYVLVQLGHRSGDPKLYRRAWDLGRHPLAALALGMVAAREGDRVGERVWTTRALDADDEKVYRLEPSDQQIFDALRARWAA